MERVDERPDERQEIESNQRLYTRRVGARGAPPVQPTLSDATEGQAQGPAPTQTPHTPIEANGATGTALPADGQATHTLVTHTLVPYNGSATPDAIPHSALSTQHSALPEPRPAADLTASALKPSWVALCFSATFLIYFLFVPRVVNYSSPPTGDQPFYLMVTMSIIQDHDLDLANNYAQHDEDKFYSLAPHGPGFVGMGAPYPLPPHPAFTPARPPTEQYNFHLPGLSLALVPAWLIGGLFALWWPATIVFMCVVGALVVTNAFLLAHELTGKLWIALAVAIPIAFSNPVMSYSYLLFTELSTGMLLIYAFRRLALGWGANGWFRLIVVGLCIAYIPWLAWRCVPISAGLAIYAAIQWWRYHRANRSAESAGSWRSRFYLLWRHLLQAAWVLVPVAISALLLIWYNLFLFGSLFPNNTTSELGNQPLFFWPWQGREQLSRFALTGYGLLFDRLNGFVLYAPIYLLSIVGAIAMFQSRRRSDLRLLLALPLVVASYYFIISSYVFWNGIWNPPARFLTTLAPLLAMPLAMSLYACRSWIYRAVYALLSIPGFVFIGVMLNDPRRFWPLNPVFEWLAGRADPTIPGALPPLFHLDIWNILPGIEPLDERKLPANSAWVTIAALAIIVLAYALMQRWRREQRAMGARPLPFALQSVVWVAAFSTVGAGWYLANYDYIQHKTELTEVGRWGTSQPLVAPRGMEYLDGKVYVADYSGQTVGVFNLDGTYQQLQATWQGNPITYAHPGDIRRGPDNNLYLLNNGPGEDALFVMTPAGQVIRKLALDSKTPVATGLKFGPDGDIYVADVTGGRILKYSPDGGQPLTSFTGKSAGFNNVTDVWVADDGAIYAAESSNRVIQAMDAQGRYVRSFDLGCQPFFMAGNGDWIDVTCEGKGIASINRKTGQQQMLGYTQENALPIANPSGLVYGPDNNLFVMDGNTLIEYKVQH